jgi:hypothetical protein
MTTTPSGERLWSTYVNVLLAFIVILTACNPAHAQKRELSLQAINGRNGKPLSNQRLLFFAGPTEEDARRHSMSFEARTNSLGLATVLINPEEVRYLQVFADFMTVCIKKPNQYTIALSEVISTGGSTPNTCGSQHMPSAPGKLIVYARQPTLKEKMAW